MPPRGTTSKNATGTKGQGKTVAEYVAGLGPERRTVFNALRELVGKQMLNDIAREARKSS